MENWQKRWKSEFSGGSGHAKNFRSKNYSVVSVEHIERFEEAPLKTAGGEERRLSGNSIFEFFVAENLSPLNCSPNWTV